MELTKAIRNEQSQNTLKHVYAITKLCTLLKERKQTRQKGPAKTEPIKIYARQLNITSEGAANSEGANKIPPTLTQPRYYLCYHALHVAASIIIEEPHHVRTFTGPRKFGDPPVSNKSTFETKQSNSNIHTSELHICHCRSQLRKIIGIS